MQTWRHNTAEVHIEAENIRTSNWLRWMNCSRSFIEENVEMMECAGRIYFITKRDIHPGEELMYYYGHGYAINRLGITYKVEM